MIPWKAAVFDLDGTLLDTLSDLAGTVNRTLSLYGYPPRSMEQIRAAVGSGARRLLELSLPRGKDTPDFDGIFSAFYADYVAHCAELAAPYPGLVALLTRLRAAGVRVAVVTNKLHSAAAALCRMHFDDLVELVLGDSPDRARKPAPDGVFAALSALGVSTDEAVYIGDSEVDVETARRAGVACVSVLWGFRREEELLAAGATCLAADTPALEKLLLPA